MEEHEEHDLSLRLTDLSVTCDELHDASVQEVRAEKRRHDADAVGSSPPRKITASTERVRAIEVHESSEDDGYNSEIPAEATQESADKFSSDEWNGLENDLPLEDDTSPSHIGKKVEFTVSQKGKRLANFLGYEFQRHSAINSSIYWRCNRRTDLNCPAKIVTNKDGFITKISNNVHPEHLLSSTRRIAREATTLMKQTAIQQPTMPTDQVVTMIRHDIHPAARALIGTTLALGRTVRRRRAAALDLTKLPSVKSLMELRIPRRFRCYKQNDLVRNRKLDKQFLLFDSGAAAGNQRFLIFGSDKCLDQLSTSKEIFADGTFAVVPALFKQLYTLHYRVGESRTTMPALYCLLPNKKKETYISLLGAVQRLAPSFNSSSVMVDYEFGAMSAFEEVFPQIRVSGCFFHLAQSQRKRLKDGLKLAIRNDANLDLQVRMVRAMALVPKTHVMEVWGELTAELDPRLDSMRKWFEETYVGRLPLRE
ncbi:hypothetical protein QR680_017238 [Steinernema hermaphroditum]|uniref:MULE transposase domain-containing protein n=1 Tax=Steinernema hermaphroditum TaxID=289476 RepID=A0AA39HED6_9BILA|nr:hypothetical protein QR680_017238 [Steinernema hermaphroditum]